ncbi:MAG: acyl-CoA dehydrogenase family protein [Thermodesulfobacteriota bacterium]|nr:acyl-CoA dehydrogenase family protein [Thermodesulfobacteriota bacterium]
MDFELTKEQKDIQMAVREFAEIELTADVILGIERTPKFPWDIWKKACELGFVGIDIPEEYGGTGYGLLERVLVTEEFSRCGAGAGMHSCGPGLGVEIILWSGNKEQKEKYIPPLCNGEAILASAFTEPDRGSDLVSAPLGTIALKDCNDYIINGTKTFITHASNAKITIVLCQTDSEATPPYSGFSTIIVEMDRPGLDVTEFEKMGWHAAPTCEISFADVRVPISNLIGEEGQGFYQSIHFLDRFRAVMGAAAVGMAQGAFERSLEYAKTREAFGRKIGQFQAIAHKLAEMATKIEASRLLVYKAASQYDQKGKLDPKLLSMAKWYPARMAVEVCDEAIEILGGHGYMLENQVELFYRDARVLEIVEGTREIQKNTIARYVLGKL